MVDRGSYNLGFQARERAYVPSFAVSVAGIEVLGNPQEAISPGVAVANGMLPGSCTGGFIKLRGETWGSDFVAARGDHQKSYLIPAEKSAVHVVNPETNIGSIEEPGLVVLTIGGLAILAGAITDSAAEADLARSNMSRVSKLENNLYVIQNGFPKRGEIVDVECDGTTVINWLK